MDRVLDTHWVFEFIYEYNGSGPVDFVFTFTDFKIASPPLGVQSEV